jgi:hypothetical protein
MSGQAENQGQSGESPPPASVKRPAPSSPELLQATAREAAEAVAKILSWT